MKYFTPCMKKDPVPCSMSCPKSGAVEVEKYVKCQRFKSSSKGWMEPRCIYVIYMSDAYMCYTYITYTHMPVCRMFCRGQHRIKYESSWHILDSDSFRLRFLLPSDLVLGQITLCCGHCPVHCGMIYSIPGLRPLAATSALPWWQPKMCPDDSNVPWGQHRPPLRPPEREESWEARVQAWVSRWVARGHGTSHMSFLGFSPISVKQRDGVRWLLMFLQP